MVYFLLDHWEQISMKFKCKYEIFLPENEFETVMLKMVAIQCDLKCRYHWYVFGGKPYEHPGTPFTNMD